MPTPHAETFEHDIIQEIKNKDGSMMDIATSVNEIGNDESRETASRNQMIFIGIVVGFTLLGLTAIGFILYLYSESGKPLPPPQKPVTVIEKPNTAMISISNVLNENIGNFLTNVQKESEGYIITITSYPPVFSYMIRNEKLFGDELATAVGNGHVIKYPEIVKTTTVIETVMPTIIEEVKATSTATSTFTSTSTKSKKIVTTKKTTSTSTLTTSTVAIVATPTPMLPAPVVIKEPQTEYIFSDITLNNQNIRVAKSAYGTVAYAFIETNKLVIASSPEGIISLRSRILKK